MSSVRTDDESGLISAIKARSKARKKVIKRQPPAIQHPDGVEREYRRYLFDDVVAPFRRNVRTQFLPQLKTIMERTVEDGYRLDAPEDEVGRLVSSLRETSIKDTEEARRKAEEIASEVSSHNRKQIKKVVKVSLGINLSLDEPNLSKTLAKFAIENAKFIKDIPAKEIRNIERLALDALTTGRRYESVAKEIEYRGSVSKSRARLIARDQVQKLNSDFTKFRQENLGIKRYRWVTSRDERVRDSHEANGGRIFSWDNPPATGHPGDDVNCRCYAEPVLEDILDQADIE